MKRTLICLMALVGSLTLTGSAVAHEDNNPSDNPQPTVATLHDTDSVVTLPKEEFTIELLKYMLSQGASLSDIENGIYMVDGHRVVPE